MSRSEMIFLIDSVTCTLCIDLKMSASGGQREWLVTLWLWDIHVIKRRLKTHLFNLVFYYYLYSLFNCSASFTWLNVRVLLYTHGTSRQSIAGQHWTNNNACRGRTRKLHAEKPQPFLLQATSATNCSTVQQDPRYEIKSILIHLSNTMVNCYMQTVRNRICVISLNVNFLSRFQQSPFAISFNDV